MILNTLWVLVAAVLVFFMQAGFALVESGFTRQKNSANIIMKNFLDFAVGSLLYYFVGFKIMFPALDIDIPTPAFLMFQLMFAATGATIVSGAVAERMKFFSYMILSILITGFIYPVSGYFIWGGGFLTDLGFHDFAGSTAVHALGGFVALGVVILLKPRIGKYSETGESTVIPGHSITLGALGVFILWFGWFGFNGGSTLSFDDPQLVSHIFVTTNISAAAGALIALFYTWIKFGHPSVGASLNGALAGLVGITAGTDVVSDIGALVIGLLSGLVVTISLDIMDKCFKIDDPVGAISVHGIGGVLGTILVGLFSTTDGLFYGGGVKLLLVQLFGALVISLYAVFLGLLIAFLLKKTVGIRVSEEEEREGLDISEHKTSSYPEFRIVKETE